MRLQRQLVWRLGATLVCLLAALIALLAFGLRAAFQQVEEQGARQDWSRAADSVHQLGNDLHVRSIDWAVWDDAYAYIKSPNDEFISSNLPPKILEEMSLSGMVFLGARNKVVYSRVESDPKGNGVKVAELVRQLGLVPNKSRFVEKKGLILHRNRPFVVSVRPIIDSERTKKPAGNLLMLKALDEAVTGQLQKRLRLSLSVIPLGNSPATTRIEIASPHQLRVSGGLSNLYGEKVFQLTVASPRELGGIGQRLSLITIGGTTLCVLLFTFSITRTLRRTLVVPLRSIIGHVAKLEKTNDVPQLELETKNELGVLATKIDRMAKEVHDRSALAERLARSDCLTDLANRHEAEVAIGKRLLEAKQFALFIIDLDNFKIINDSHGHNFGDALLKVVADRLKSVSHGGFVARLGGDEFLAILDDVRKPQQVEIFAEELTSLLNNHVKVDGLEIFLAGSIGATIAESHMTRGDLMRQADTAMYEAKGKGKGRWCLFDQSMESRVLRRAALENGLRTALDRDELRLVYQPIVDLATGNPTSMEVLARWNSPDLGFVSPAEFIPVAEETGLVIPIGMWALRNACFEALNWRGVKVNVNMSQRQLQSAGIVDQVKQVLDETKLPVDRLVLEVTESMVMENSDTVIETLHGLKSLGITLSLDDFGTGYSSLSYLQRLPVDGVKIDRSFVSLLNSEEEPTPIILAMVAIADAMNLSITAEGVETEEQLLRLHEMGCHYGQGYLYSKPMPADGVRTYIQAGRRHRAA